MPELPLFPLNTVLFPHALLHLHIFEERYQRMIGMCLQEKRPFGVVLIRRGLEALGPLAEPHEIGCTANIVRADPLEGGRMNLFVKGAERFRILSLDATTQPYLVAKTERLPWPVADRKRLTKHAGVLRERVQRYIDLVESSGARIANVRLPGDPVALAGVAASILGIEPVQMQALLELPDAGQFFDNVLAAYRREQALMQAILLHAERDRGLPFSQN